MSILTTSTENRELQVNMHLWDNKELKMFCEKGKTSSEGWVESPSVEDVEIQEDVWYDADKVSTERW